MTQQTTKKIATGQSIWLGFAEKRPTGRGTVRVHFRFGRIAAGLLFLAFCFYVTAITAIYYIYKEQKGYHEISYTDVLLIALPGKRNEIRRAHGDYNIRQAEEAIADQKFREAYNLLMNGVRRSPSNLEGRLQLIRFFEAQGYHEGTRQLLESGREYAGEDIDFYRYYGQFLTNQRADDELMALTDELHQTAAEDSALSRVMALFAMQAALRQGDFDRAEKYFAENELQNNLEGVLTAAQALKKFGDLNAAIAYLELFISRFRDQEIGLVYRTLGALQIEAGQADDAVSTALAYSLKQPLSYQPRIQILRAYREAGREEDAKREAQALVRQFRTDAGALGALGLYARDTGDIDLARRLYEIALENDINIPRFGLFFLEAHLNSKQFARTLQLCDQLEAESPSWLKIYAAEFAVMQAIAHLKLGDQQLGNLYLNEFLNDRSDNVAVLVAVAMTMQQLGLDEYALQVLETASARDENNETALASLVDLQITLGESRELTERVEQLIKLRRPDYQVFSRVKSELNSDRFIFAAKRSEVSAELANVLNEVAGETPTFAEPGTTSKGPPPASS